MKKEFCLTIAVFVFSLVLGTDMSFGLDRELYLQDTEQIIERMEAGDGAQETETGISFNSEAEARDFADYFYKLGYLGEVQVNLLMRTWQDCPSYVEISVRSSDTKLAAAQQRQAEQIFTGISDQIASRTDEQMARAEAAYDWLYANYAYDYSYESKKIYTALTTGKTVCFGYAGSYKVLCDYLGLECEMLYGSNHVWNRVKVDGHWRYVDITWDKNLEEHRWRLVSEDEWKSTHPLGKEGS